MPERTLLQAHGAIQLTDGVTGAVLRGPLQVAAKGLDIRRNRSGLHVIFGAAGLGGNPAPGSVPFEVTVSDPGRAFLPARAAIGLPRRFDPAAGQRERQTPMTIALASSPARAGAASWATVHVRVADTGGAPVRGAYVEAAGHPGGDLLGWGITGVNGEALVPVPGLPMMREAEAGDPANDADNDIVTAETEARLSARVPPGQPWPADTGRLAAGGAGFKSSAAIPVFLSPGRQQAAGLVIDLT